MTKIDLSEWSKFGGGAEGSSWYSKTDDTVMLKLFDSLVSTDAEKIAQITAEVTALGISTPKVYEVVEDEQGHKGILFERLQEKVSLLRMVLNDRKDLEKSAEIFGKELKKLHATPSNTAFFEEYDARLKKRLQYHISMMNIADEEKADLQTLMEAFWKKREALPKATTCLMGDCHPGNIVVSRDVPYFIDLGTFAYGHPYNDLGYFYFSSHSDILFSDAVKAFTPPEDILTKEEYIRYWEKLAATYIGSDKKEDLETFTKAIMPYTYVCDIIMSILFMGSYEAVKAVLMKALA